jgi:ferritin
LYFIISTAQTVSKYFETQNEIKEECLKGIPAYLRATALQQVQSMKKAVMFLQDGRFILRFKQAEIENKRVVI